MPGMKTASALLLGLALFMTLAVLFAGLIAMARGGEFNKRHGNKLMRYRVIAQAVALVIFAVAMLMRGD